jgi:hypothetical protein
MTDMAKTKRTRRFTRTPNTDAAPEAAAAPHAEAESPAPAAEPAARPESKSSRIVALMQRGEGATLEEMVTATGWLPHTTRAAMTGLKRKGHAISSVKTDGVRRYFVTAAQ